jgi:hypothetical protein
VLIVIIAALLLLGLAGAATLTEKALEHLGTIERQAVGVASTPRDAAL